MTVLIALGAADCSACRYSVRDLGFIDHGEERLRLVVEGADAAEVANGWRSRLRERDLALPVVVSESGGAEGAAFLLAGEERLPLEVGDFSAASLPAALSGVADELREPTRLLLTHGCLVLFAEGADASQNEQAIASLQAAIARAVEESDLWEKPMDAPPELVRWDASSAATNGRVTLWSLGFAPDEDAPQAAVVYGRWRRIGPVFVGADIESGRIARTIGLLGRDCECDLSRTVFDGPQAPHPWSPALAALARERLGFDPEHPMTQLEARQILAAKPSSGRDAFAGDAYLGYQEIDLSAALSGGLVVEDKLADPPHTPEKPLSAGGAAQSATEPPPVTPAVAEADAPPYGAIAAAVAVLAGVSITAGLWLTRSAS